ncbi:MAG: DUF1343 domain-containing protein [Pyrinomonadaceae bacterium MAG19_C2-C3]|nr:DUF1343 domain-containing protein [Pyrinomonadaceae bacterium MAG19_C2-C3]
MRFTNNIKIFIVPVIVALVIIAPLHAQQIANSGMDAARLKAIDKLVTDAIARRETPGAVVLVGHKNKVVFRKAYGNRAVMPMTEAMTTDTVFDVASLTKVVATTTSVMQLVGQGKLKLNASIADYIPELKNTDRAKITVEDLLTHTGGYAPDFDLREQWTGTGEAMKRLYIEPLRATPKERFVYSDIGFIALGEIVKRVSGQSLDEYARLNIFEPLAMRDTGFRRIGQNQNVSRLAPTETARATNTYLGGTGEGKEIMLRGTVHDPTAQRMEGVAGHAGLFSTADDLSVFCQMLLDGGALGGKRILSALTINEMISPRVISDTGATRGLGWDMRSAYSANRGELFPSGSFGHTGFTGTSIWIDPASETYVIFLSNRVHPDGKGNVTPLRGQVSTVVAASITDNDATRTHTQETLYQSSVNTQLARRAMQVKSPSNNASSDANRSAQVLNGIDVLERDGFKQLQNMRVGLVTNHTGRNLNGKPTIDVLREASGVKLVSLFSPEHGIRGAVDEKVVDSTDEKTGLPVYSLYGETRRPKPEQLKDLDAIVFDIQDIGARFYTYISTLGNVMEEAAKLNKSVFILDRPNPINGVDVEGALADADKLSFTAYHTIPIRHGLTIGELGLLFNRERKINCDLRVIKLENWQRAMWFDRTNQTWINPSPNMRSLTQATLYPGIGLLETTNLSVGRGTDTPFQIIGAPYINERQLAAELNARSLRGLRFVPVRFTPRASVFKDESCGGVELIIINRAEFEPIRTGLEIANALIKLYPTSWKTDSYNRLLANTETYEAIKRGTPTADIMRAWQSALNDFKNKRASALLY